MRYKGQLHDIRLETNLSVSQPQYSMKKTFCLLLCLSLLVFAGCNSSSRLNKEELRKDIDPNVAQVIERHRESIAPLMKSNDIPGLAIAIVDREGVLWSGGFGISNSKNKSKTTPDTLFSIQSNSKTIAALAVMFAVQEGMLDLDVPISTYLPDFKINSCYEREAQNRITLRHLLNHTSGLAHEAPVGNNIDASFPSFEAHIKSIEETWLRGKVGEHYYYSNLGIDLAVWILQEVSKESYSDYLNHHVFNPLGLTDSLVDPNKIAEKSDTAIGHINSFVKPGFVRIPMLGAGGIYSSAMDVGKLIQFFLNKGEVGGKQKLKSRFIDEIYTPTLASGSYGMGIDRIAENETFSLSHNGMGFGFKSTVKWYPDYGIGCCVMTNNMGDLIGGDNQHIVLCDQFLSDLIETEFYREKRTKNTFFDPIAYTLGDRQMGEGPELHSTFKTEWRKYVGTYALVLNGYEFKWYAKLAFRLGYTPAFLKLPVYEKDGELWVGRQPLFEHSEGLFFNPYGQCLDFRSDQMTWRNMKMKKIN